MRTTLDLDPSLLSRAMKAAGARTKKAAVEAGLRAILQKQAREELIAMLGMTDLSVSLEDLLDQRKMKDAKVRRR